MLCPCCPFSRLFSRKFSQHFLLNDRLVCFILVEQLGDDSWYVQLAAIWHWCAFIMFLIFFLFLFIPFLYFSLP